MQSFSECAMSFLLGSAVSFTVDWFLFRSRGQAAGVGNGPDVRCMVDGSAAPGPRAVAAGRRRGLCWPCRVSRSSPSCGPPFSLPTSRSFVRGERGITPARSRRHHGPGPAVSARTAVRVAAGASPAVSGGGGLALSVKSVAQCNSPISSPPIPRFPPLPDEHRRPHALRHDTAFVLLIWEHLIRPPRWHLACGKESVLLTFAACFGDWKDRGHG
ncbi:uncharacterized protein LJ264_006609 isoform 1-T1 [Porphyrio hochstetteri]